MLTKSEKLAMLVNRRTRYELVAQDGERIYCIAYCARKSRTGAIDAIRKNSVGFLSTLGLPRDVIFKFMGRDIRAGSWLIHFTGRTQRDAIMQGKEYPRITAAQEVQP